MLQFKKSNYFWRYEQTTQKLKINITNKKNHLNYEKN